MNPFVFNKSKSDIKTLREHACLYYFHTKLVKFWENSPFSWWQRRWLLVEYKNKYKLISPVLHYLGYSSCDILIII